MHKVRRSRRLQLETLETRRPLAGNVTAIVVNGHLTLVGDASANQVFVGDLGGGRFAVRGLAGDTGSATTINGQSEVIVENVSGDMNFDLGDGTDLFYLANDSDWNGGDPFAGTWGVGGFAPLASVHGFAHVQGKLTLNLGNGNDTAVVAASAGGGMFLRGGFDGGDDGLFVRTNPDQPTAFVDLDLGEGNDYAAISLSNLGNSAVRTGGGNDTLRFAFYGSDAVTVDLGGGDDRLVFQGGADSWKSFGGDPVLSPRTNLVDIRGGAGNDDLLVGELRAGSLNVDSGTGRDTLLVRGITIAGDVSIRGGSAAGSSIVVQDYAKPMPSKIDDSYGGLYPQVVIPVPTEIGGNLTVNFNADLAALLAAGSYSVTVGEEQYGPRDFDVKGQLRVFGTVGNDDVFLRRLSAGSIAVDTGWGADYVQAGGIAVSGNVSVRLGDGDDRGLYLEDNAEISGYRLDGSISGYDYRATRIDGDVSIDLGAGVEAEVVGNTLVLPRVLFSAGARNSGLIENFIVGGRLNVNIGPGYADFQVLAARLGSAEIRTGNDGSRLRMSVFTIGDDLSIFGGVQSDEWRLNAFGVRGDMALHTGHGHDDIRLNAALSLAADTQGRLDIFAGEGNDWLQIGGDHTQSSVPVGEGLIVRGGFSLDTGAGGDTVTLWKVHVLDLLMSRMGEGDDTLAVMRVKALRGRFDGGAGRDLISPLVPADYGNVQKTNFEGDLFLE